MYKPAGEGTKILRGMRKGKKANATKKLNTSRPFPQAGIVMSHVAQGILRNSRKVVKDHVIWKPDEDRTEVSKNQSRTPTESIGGQLNTFGGQVGYGG